MPQRRCTSWFARAFQRRELVEPSTRATTTAQSAGRTRGLRGSMVCIISAKAWT
ncbi:hypothetical protein BHM03_00059448, partial [Ensete ventricosum]